MSLPILYKNDAPATGQDSLYASATFDKNTSELILKVVNTLGKEQKVAINLDGKRKPAATAEWIVLKNSNLEAVNSLDDPSVISPSTENMELKGKTLGVTLRPYSFSVFKIKMQ